MTRILILFFCFCLAHSWATAQFFKRDSVKEASKRIGIVALPAMFVSPETSLGFGGASIFYVKSKKDTAQRPTNLQSVFIYTLQNQILFTNKFNVFAKEEKYWFNGEFGFYIYPFRFYGIGDNIDVNQFEPYSVNFLRIEMNARKQVRPRFYIGPTLLYDEYFQITTEKDGILETQNILGTKVDRLFGLGISTIIDHRDNLFCPYEGYYIEGRALVYEDYLLGGYSFSDLYIDLRKYFYIGDRFESGLNLYHQSILGDPPFYNLSQMGNSRQMRGYFRGAYRDKHQTLLQGEIRSEVIPRIYLSTFAGLGYVNSDFNDFDKLLGSYGVGLRYEIDPKDRLRIRFDYARGHQTSGFYININEAF